jgi:hypothetical protein
MNGTSLVAAAVMVAGLLTTPVATAATPIEIIILDGYTYDAVDGSGRSLPSQLFEATFAIDFSSGKFTYDAFTGYEYSASSGAHGQITIDGVTHGMDTTDGFEYFRSTEFIYVLGGVDGGDFFQFYAPFYYSGYIDGSPFASLDEALLEPDQYGSSTETQISFPEEPGTFSSIGVVTGVTVLGVPEPSAWSVLCLGVLGLGAALRRRRDLALRLAPARMMESPSINR